MKRILLLGNNESTESYAEVIKALDDSFEILIATSEEDMQVILESNPLHALRRSTTVLLVSPITSSLFVQVVRLGFRVLQSAEAITGANIISMLGQSLAVDLLYSGSLVCRLPPFILKGYTAEPTPFTREDLGAIDLTVFGDYAPQLLRDLDKYRIRFGTIYMFNGRPFAVPVIPTTLLTERHIHFILKELEAR